VFIKKVKLGEIFQYFIQNILFFSAKKNSEGNYYFMD